MSCSLPPKTAASLAEEKSPARPGKRANSRDIPPVTPRAVSRPFLTFLSGSGSLANSAALTPSMPIRSGTVTCRMTRIMDTVLNLLYSGAYLKNISENHIKCEPQPSSKANMETPAIHHLYRPLITHRPNTKRKRDTAPRYIGPAVKGWGPQYRGIPLRMDSALTP